MLNSKRPSFGPYPPQNASLLLEKTKANIRRSTPDSEALASSDDDQDQLQRSMTTNMPGPQQPSKPTRRPSWLSDTYATAQRKTSSGSLDALAPGSAHGMTSSVDAGANWGAGGAARGHTSAASLPWNNTIWSNENSRFLPARFSEVLPSPTSLPNSSNAMDPSHKTNSPRRDSSSEAAIPFPIPLQPTLKTYRSQSYSVGQMEQEANAAPGAGRGGQYAYNGRTRAGSSFGTMHHRQGRPSVYGEFSGDNLGQVQEVEDDEESATSSDGGVRFHNSQARTIEQLAMENAVLRQQAMANHAASFSGPFAMGTNPIPRTNMRGFQLSDSVLEEPDDHSLGDEDLRSSNHSSLSGLGQHRYNGSGEGLRNASPEYFGNAGTSKSPAGFKRGQWHTPMGFGGYGDNPQSRRHSFADVPRRTLSGNPHEPSNPNDLVRARAGLGDPPTPQAEGSPYLANASARVQDSSRSSSAHGVPMPFAPPAQPRMQPFGGQHQVPQSLYLVTFKAARAEFYYVQEGTGLEVNEGDLVIVEADRGTDLGTVAHRNVDWSVARELKEHYVQEHYNWLMMFSRQGQAAAAAQGGSARPGSAGTHKQPGLISGFGSQGSSSSNEASVAEIKPKMIKRLAQTHEIHTLREKEGNEAKAKRMCQQKVAEHHLNMEILDAEFQMDWKKLTFYYFADAYINFNSLVTDLFKIYKTRIWMSAINPASFVSRNSSLPPLAGASSTAFGGQPYGQQSETRQQNENGGYGGMSNDNAGYRAVQPQHEQQAYDAAAWGYASNGAFPSPGGNPYAQYWATPGMAPVGQFSGRAHATASPGMHRHDASSPQEQMQGNYVDQLTLQGLSLGN